MSYKMSKYEDRYYIIKVPTHCRGGGGGGGKIVHIYSVLGPHTAAVKPAVDLAVK